ncbi:MAG TPA: hypothetical protein VFQ92_20300, partial [Blastocatellia bacterium]|nr:hypothetical protein [Blastocatellia bacterium]
MTGERRSSQNSVTHVLLFFSLAFSLLFIVRVAATVLPLIRAGRNDFAPLYSSSRLVIEGKGEQLYDQQVQYEIQADLFERGESGPLVFYYLSYITLLWI